MLIELPLVRQEGADAMMRGRQMAGLGCPDGFTFNPYRPGSTESENFRAGCLEAAYKAFH